MEHSPTQSTNPGVSLPNKDERSIKESAIVQALYAEFEGQLVWPQIEPALLLGLLEGRKEEEEQQQWEEVDRKAGFHDKEEDLTSEAWDVREAINAIKDEEMD